LIRKLEERTLYFTYLRREGRYAVTSTQFWAYVDGPNKHSRLTWLMEPQWHQ